MQPRAVLPAGWFQQGNPPASLTGSRVSGVRPVAHYDTLGAEGRRQDPQGMPGAARRLRQLRQPGPNSQGATMTAPQAQPGLNPAGAPALGNSSRRRVDVASRPEFASPVAGTGAAAAAALSLPTQPAGSDPAAISAPATPMMVPGAGPSVMLEPTPATVPNQEASEPLASGATAAGGQPSPAETNAVEAAGPTSTPLSVGTDLETVTAPAAADASAVQDPQPTPAVAPSAETNAAGSSPAESAILESAEAKAATETTTANATDAASPEAMTTAEPIKAVLDSSTPGAGVTEADATGAAAEDGILLNEEAPVLSVKTRGPKTMVVGKVATYVINLSNHSEGSAKEVVVRMNIPAWVEVAQQEATLGNARLQPDDSGHSVLSWTVGSLSGRADEKLTLGLIPRSSRALDLGVTWTFAPASTTTQIQVQEPKLQMSVSGPQDLLFGETKVYTVTISNPGTGDAENVVLNLLPLVAGERTAGVRQLGTLSAGSSRTVEVELTARQTGRIHVRAEATADAGLTARGDQEVQVRRAALEVVAEGAPKKFAGTRSRYAIRVTNSGDALASNVVVAATLPAGAQTVASSDGGMLNPQTGQVQWSLGDVRPGASRVLEVECTLVSPGDNRLEVKTVAEGDLNAVASVSTQVEALADLKLTVNDPQGAVAVGDDVTYEVRIVNRGTKAAEDIQIYGYFSEGIEPTSVQGWKGSLSEGEVVLQSIPRLGPGQEMLVRIQAQARRAGDHVFRAEVESKEPQTKLAVEEWTRFYTGDDASMEAEETRTAGDADNPPRR